MKTKIEVNQNGLVETKPGDVINLCGMNLICMEIEEYERCRRCALYNMGVCHVIACCECERDDSKKVYYSVAPKD